MPLRPTFLRLPGLGLALLPAIVLAQKPAFTIESRPEPERPYRLFVGIDVRVLHDDDFTTVADFRHDRTLLADPAHTELPIGKINALRFDHATKLSGLTVTIDSVTSEPAYSQGNPRWEWMMAQSGVQGQVQDRLSAMERNISRAGSLPSSAAITTPDGNTVAATNPMADAVADYTSFANQTAKLADSSFYAEKAEEEGGTDAFDAIVVAATVSAPVPVADAYAVGIARIRTEAEGLRDLIFFNDVGDLGPEPRVVKMRKEGLPPGFEIVKIDLHLYREGQELVSNRSPKQFALTRDEALEYLSLDRLSSHAGETLPATPAWELAPADLFAATDPATLDLALTVQVDAKGRCTGIVSPADAPPPLAALARQVLFRPALQAGEPVATTTPLNLRDFFR